MDAAALTPEPAGASGVALDAWLAAHGPLWPPVALALALDACARASRMTDPELRLAIGSLNASAVSRDPGSAGWAWVPSPAGEPMPRAVRDDEVLERIGAILFQSLTGHPQGGPFAAEPILRTRLRTLRPDLSPAVTDLTVHAIAAGRNPGLTLAAFSRDARAALGIKDPAASRRQRRVVIGFAASAVVIAVLGAARWTTGGRGTDRAGSHGLTAPETTVLDMTEETAQTFTFMDENTSALQLYASMERLWDAHLEREDPRRPWVYAHESWVRLRAGDRLTEEQLLIDAPRALSVSLGKRHPYTRAARLALADTLTARGAIREAAVLRQDADSAMRELLGNRAVDVLPAVPSAPGVRAHLSPNAPELEGFRRASNGGYELPLTTMQRVVAGRLGWRLHLIAGGSCRASVVVGIAPRRITVATRREPDGSWHVQLEGTKSAATLTTGSGDTVIVSLLSNGADSLTARVNDQTTELGIDTSSPAPDPPHTLAFTGDPAAKACALVWLEIPFRSANTLSTIQ